MFSLSALELLVAGMWVAGVVVAILLPTSQRVRAAVLIAAITVPVVGSIVAVVIGFVARRRRVLARRAPSRS